MTPARLTGDELDAKVREHGVDENLSADEKRAAIAEAEGTDDVASREDDPVHTLGDGPAADRVREALDDHADEDGDHSSAGATREQNAELEHTMGGPTTRDDPHDQGVPMLQGDPEEPVGPEDAAGIGPKRGDYESRVLPSLGAHEAVRIDGASGAAGPQVVNDDGGIDNLPHTVLRPQAPRFADQGEDPGVKGGVETDPNHP